MILSLVIESLFTPADLTQAKIDARVKLICEKSLPPNVVAPQILTVLSAEDKLERLKVTEDRFYFYDFVVVEKLMTRY